MPENNQEIITVTLADVLRKYYRKDSQTPLQRAHTMPQPQIAATATDTTNDQE